MPGLDRAAELLPPSPARRSRCRGSARPPIDRGRRQRRVLVEHRGRPAGQDHAFRPHRREGLVRLLERHDLAIDLLLAHPPRDQLGHLRAEIDDENLVVPGEPVGAGAAHEGGIQDGHGSICGRWRPRSRPQSAVHHRLDAGSETIAGAINRILSGAAYGDTPFRGGNDATRRGCHDRMDHAVGTSDS